MKTIARALQAGHTVGDRIDLPWPHLNRDLSIHTKELVLVAGAPGAGKSVFALNVAMSMEEPVLYIAQDSVPSVLARVAALALGVEISWIFDALRIPSKKEEIMNDLADAYPNLFIHSGSVTVEGIEARLEALTEVLGKAPQMVIIDNLIDMQVPGSHHQELGFYAMVLPELKQISHRHNTCIVALHHVTRPEGLGTTPLKMTHLLFSGERDAEHVLGIFHGPEKDRMLVQILKQRDGAADPEGGLQVPLVWHPPFGSLGRA